MKAHIRSTSYADPKVAELARDIQQAFDSIGQEKIVSFTREYAEPMLVSFDHEPLGVQLLRIRKDDDPEAAVQANALVSYVYRGGGIEITELVGPVVGTRYRFAFKVVG